MKDDVVGHGVQQRLAPSRAVAADEVGGGQGPPAADGDERLVARGCSTTAARTARGRRRRRAAATNGRRVHRRQLAAPSDSAAAGVHRGVTAASEVGARSSAESASIASTSAVAPVKYSNAATAWKTFMPPPCRVACPDRAGGPQERRVGRPVDDVGDPQVAAAGRTSGTGDPGWCAIPTGVVLMTPSAFASTADRSSGAAHRDAVRAELGRRACRRAASPWRGRGRRASGGRTPSVEHGVGDRGPGPAGAELHDAVPRRVGEVRGRSCAGIRTRRCCSRGSCRRRRRRC